MKPKSLSLRPRPVVAVAAAARLLLVLLLTVGTQRIGRAATATADSVFPQSVASGDPTPTSVVLWTRVVDPLDPASPADLPLELEVATDPAFAHVVQQRTDLLARAAFDRCVKTAVQGLTPHTFYYYRFGYGGTWSHVGRTRTAPAPDQPVPQRFAYLNCQDYIGRYYNTLAHLVQSESNRLDFVVHLGDYIYETTGDSSFQSTGAVRRIEFTDQAGAIRLGPADAPYYAASSLDNYRQLYRTYRSDPNLQRVHELFPVVAMWDDHEYSNDQWRNNATYFDGRQSEADTPRRQHAEQAYFEYLPIGVGLDTQGVQIDSSILYPNTRIYRHFQFGSLLDLFLTDYRTYRPDHLIPEDAFPGTVAIDDATCSNLLGEAWPTARGSFDPYVDIDDPSQGGLKAGLVQIVTAAYLQEGLTGVGARARAVSAVTGNLSTTYVNALLVAAGQPAAFPPEAQAALPRGLSFLLLGKQALFSQFGSRYLVPRTSYQLYAAYRGLLDPASQDAYGPAQTADLTGWLTTSLARWKVVGSSVSFTPLGFDFANPPLPLPPEFPAALRTHIQLNAEDWDGFPNGRQAVLDLLAAHNAVVISGDIHASFITRHNAAGGRVVPEFTGAAVSSETFREELRSSAEGNPATAGLPGLEQLLAATDVLLADALHKTGLGELLGARSDANGYVVMQATAEGLTAEYRHLPRAYVEEDLGTDATRLNSLFSTTQYHVAQGADGVDFQPEEFLQVGANLYTAFHPDLTNGTWVYVDADPTAGSPLRATQRALGYREVDYKAAVYPTLFFSPVGPTTNGPALVYDYTAQANKTNTVGFWANKDLPIIIGPDGNAYITDGHHTTASYLPPLSPVHEFIPGLKRLVLGHIVANYYDPLAGPQAVTDDWWLARAAENNAFLYGTNGNQLTLPGEPGYDHLQPILPSVLPMPTTPSTLNTNGATAMLPCVERGLTWGLADGIVLSALDGSGKKIAGFKKSAPGSSVDINFVEFYWADFLRNRVVWDDTKTGSPYDSTNGDASVISAPFSFFTAVANGIALARSEAYRDQYGRRLSDYTNSTTFSRNTVNWANGSLSNGLAKATDTYHLYFRDDSSIAGDVQPSARSTNILHIDTDSQLVITQALRNLTRLAINGGGTLKTSWKDTTVSNSTLRLPAGVGIVILGGTADVAHDTVVSGGSFEVAGTLNAGSLSVAQGLLYGDGVIQGPVAVQADGTFMSSVFLGAPRLNGPLALAGTMWAEAFKNGPVLLAAPVTGIGTLTYGGTLALDVAGGPLAAGDTVKLFDAAHYTGAFSAFDLPDVSAGLAWDSTGLLVDGTLRVGLAGASGVTLAASPASQTANVGSPVTLVGGAVGSLPIAYQWWLNGVEIPGATNATLSIASVQDTDQGQYYFVASNAVGVLESAPATLIVNHFPVADAQSLDFVWVAAQSLTLSGSDSDGDPLLYVITDPPTKGTLTGSGPNREYRPFLGANGKDSFKFKVNDGRADSAPATVTLHIAGWANQGLVGVGRVPADSFDARGPGLDTLGGIGSAAFFDPTTWVRTDDGNGGSTYGGTLYALPDRGFGDGTQNYLPRIETMDFSITPYYGPGPVGQTQIVLKNTATLLLTAEGANFTGYDADDRTSTSYPRSTAGSLGQGQRSLDAEGLVRLADGSFFVSDEYGPLVYKFDAAGALEYMLRPPESILPKLGAYPGTNYFTATNAPASGRRNNRGLEGLSLAPDGKRLFAMLQSPAMQDSGAGSAGRNTRVLVFDVDPASATFQQPLAEYVYVLTMNGSAQTNKNTPVSEILALNRQEFLVLERDSGQGLGTGTNLVSTYKRVVLASTTGASNILNTPFDLEKGAPGQVSFAASGLPAGVTPVQRFDLVDLLDPVQLARFGLNNSTNQDQNTLSEKWESLALVPLNDPAAPNDHLLLVMNDNDFKAPVVYHNGVVVGTNDVPVDTMMLGFRVSLPTYNAPVPANLLPGVQLVGPTNATLSTPVTFTLTANAYDQDGRITRVEFWSGDTKLAEDTSFPFQLAVTDPPPGEFTAFAIAYDNDGAAGTSGVYRVAIAASNLAPAVSLSSPIPGAAYMAPANFNLSAIASDLDGWIGKVELFRDATRLTTLTAPPYTLALANHPLGTFEFTAVATDNQGAVVTSAATIITVAKNSNSTPVRLQVLHASDLEAGVNAVFDAPAFSSVVDALKAQYPTNTLFLLSGDNFIPGPFFNAGGDPAAGFNGVAGRADIAMLDALGVQASALGNHDFDAGTSQLRSLILRDAAVSYPGTLFPYLSANLDFSTDSSMASLVSADRQVAATMSNKVARSCVIPVAGELVGIVGATTADLRAISSPGTVGVNTNITAAVQAAVDGLLPLGVNKVIVLAHLQQYANELALAQQLRDVDVVIAGGSHAIFAKPADHLRAGDVASTNYPVWLNSAAGEPVAVVNAGANYEYVGRLVLDFDASGRVTGEVPTSGIYATDEDGLANTGNYPPNPTVLNIATNIGAIINAKDGNLFGWTTVYLNGLRPYVRTEESNLGDLSADANLWRGRQTDPDASLSLKNGGGIRDSIGAVLGYGGGAAYVPPLPNPTVGKEFGQISQLDIENALRFNNGLSLVTLTAQQLRDTLEWGVAAVAPGATPGQFPQVSGLWFSYNPTNPPMTYAKLPDGTVTGIATAGSRLQTLVATRGDGTLDLVVENGALVGDADRTFRMVTLDFMAGGGDNYYPITQGKARLDLVTATNKTFTTDGSEQWALASYLTNLVTHTLADTPAAEDQRIQNTGLRTDTVSWPLLTRVVAGEGVTVYFTTLPGKHYEVWAAEQLGGQWVNLTSVAPIAGSGSLASFTDTAGTAARFYRIWRVD